MTADAVLCEWNAGADRYVGSVPAAIAAYGFPAATQAELIAQWEERRWADVVTIDRDSIRSRTADYGPDMRQMNFGGKGRRCERVSRAKWTASHAETAIVLCADGECVAVPSVCSNVSRVTRIDRAAPLFPPISMTVNYDGSDLRIGGPIGFAYATPIPLAMVPAGAVGGYGPSWGAAAGFGYGIDYVRQDVLCDCVPTPPCPVAAVPEPMTAVLLIGGFAAVAVWSKRA